VLATAPHRRPTKSELEAAVKTRRIDGIVSTVQSGIKWFSLAAIAWWFYQSIRVLSGQYTFADIGVRFIGDFRISEGLAYVFGAGGIAYGYNERRLRRSTIERLAPRNAALEQTIDPGRTSSKLTARGTTRPEDSI
jgi:hypothetical protein